ncbi:hypothetical protein CBS101457_001005 [Exobasidium rhododendri]|nr:hypothetical protein CBS101457_001005 [Exobasidium rhododendri]
MRPSLALWSKASRLPLNSKKANKDFYKGTRAGNIMIRKRIAVANRNTGEQLYDEDERERTWNLKTHRIDEGRVTSYIVPPGLSASTLRPLVFLGKRAEGGVESRPDHGYPGAAKMRQGGGLDAQVYMDVRHDIIQRRVMNDDTQNSLSEAKRIGRKE